MEKNKRKRGGMRKHGRSKRKGQDQPLSLYVRNKISFEQYARMKGIKRVK